MAARLTPEHKAEALRIVQEQYPLGTTIEEICKLANVKSPFVKKARIQLGLTGRIVASYSDDRPGEKRCGRCNTWKPRRDFRGDPRRPGGKTSYCFACEKAFMDESREKDRSFWLYSSTRSGAKARGLTHTIKPSDIVIPTHCPILGIPLFFTPGSRTDNSPSVDRIDNARGYEPGNILVISYRANFLKSDASIEEMKALVSFYERFQPSREDDAQFAHDGSGELREVA